jgi:hypothetical protein
MDKSTQDEKIEMLACYAVSMHLEANRKVGNAAKIVSIVSVLFAIYVSSFWPIAIAVALCIAIYFFMIQSCLRFVEKETGMPQDVQATFSQRYKIDAPFADKVDALREGASHFANLHVGKK